MGLSALDTLFWALGVVGHLVLLGVLVARRRARHFPLFTALIALAVTRSFVLFFVRAYGSSFLYFRAYWGLAIVDSLLQLAVVFEVATHVFRPMGRWARDTRRSMWLMAVASIVLASALTAMAAPAATNWRELLVIRGSFFSSALLSELFVGMVVLSVTAGLPWRTHVARIAHGLGAYSLLDIAIEAGHTLYGTGYKAHIDDLLSDARMLLYLGCLLYWIVTLWQQAPEPRELPDTLRKHLRVLQTRLAYDLYTFRSWRK